jgi:hypothetical protein
MIEWKNELCLDTDNGGIMYYRATYKEHIILAELNTHKKSDGSRGPGTWTFYIHFNPQAFATEAELLQAIDKMEADGNDNM